MNQQLAAAWAVAGVSVAVAVIAITATTVGLGPKGDVVAADVGAAEQVAWTWASAPASSPIVANQQAATPDAEPAVIYDELPVASSEHDLDDDDGYERDERYERVEHAPGARRHDEEWDDDD